MKRSKDQRLVLDLRSLVIAASGKQRNVFLLHGQDLGPDFPDVPIVIKVPKQFQRQLRLSRSKRVLRSLYPASSLRAIRKEVKYRAKVSKIYVGPPHQLPIPAFLGFVETSDGKGALWEAICDEKGQLAPTLKNLVDENKVAEVLEPLNSFVQTCLKTALVVTDMQYRNLVFGNNAGKKQFFIVDGFGDHRMLSLREMSRHYGHGKLIQCFEKVSRQAGLTFDNRTNRFCLVPRH